MTQTNRPNLLLNHSTIRIIVADSNQLSSVASYISGATVPAAPSILVHYYNGSSVTGSIIVPPNNTGSALTGYKVYLENSTGGAISQHNYNIGDNFNITGLSTTGIYQIRATTTNEIGEGASSEAIRLAPILRVPSSESSISLISANTLRINYIDENLDNPGYAPVTFYTVKFTDDNDNETIRTSSGNALNISGLTETAYTVQFRVNNFAGAGPYSEEYRLRISSTPEQPISPKIISRGNNFDILLFETSDNGSAITSYEITISYDDAGGNPVRRTISVSPSQLSYVFTNAIPGIVYSIFYKAINSHGASPASETVHHTHIVSLVPDYLPRSTYEIKILDYNGNEVLRMNDSEIIELEYDKVYNDFGSFSITMTGFLARWFEENLILPKGLDYFVDISRRNPGKDIKELDETFLYRYINIYYTEDNTLYAIIGGHSLNKWLTYRPIHAFDNPYSARGRYTDAGEATEVMARLVRYNLGIYAPPAKRHPKLTVISYGDGNPAGGDWGITDNLFDVLGELARRGEVQFVMKHVGNNNVECHIGKVFKDRTIHTNYGTTNYTLLKEERDNLSQQSLIIDYQDVSNVVYTVKSSDTSEDIIREVSGIRYDESPYNTIEFVEEVTATDEDVANIEVLTKGASALAENAPKEEITFSIENKPGLLYKKDWDVGDIITAEWKGRSKNFRVSGVGVSFRNGEESIDIQTTVEGITQYNRR